MKTARFTNVVSQCGRPVVHVSWLPAEKDPVLKQALKENRVLTLHQELHGGKKDFGTVGFFKDRHAQLLIFPKSLRRFAGQRIVAINYDLLSEGRPQTGRAPAVPPRRKTASPSSFRRSPTAPPPPPAAHEKAPPAPGKSAPAESSDRQPTPASRKLVTELRRVRDELATGKAVPAFQRIERLLAALEA